MFCTLDELNLVEIKREDAKLKRKLHVYEKEVSNLVGLENCSAAY